MLIKEDVRQKTQSSFCLGNYRSRTVYRSVPSGELLSKCTFIPLSLLSQVQFVGQTLLQP